MKATHNYVMNGIINSYTGITPSCIQLLSIKNMYTCNLIFSRISIETSQVAVTICQIHKICWLSYNVNSYSQLQFFLFLWPTGLFLWFNHEVNVCPICIVYVVKEVRHSVVWCIIECALKLYRPVGRMLLVALHRTKTNNCFCWNIFL